MGAKIIHVYDLTETYTVCAAQPAWEKLPVEEKARLKARQGVAYTIADDVRVVDIKMVDVPANSETMGEVIMRGNNVMKGYYNDLGPPTRHFEAAGSIAATWPSCTPMATLSCMTKAKTSSVQPLTHDNAQPYSDGGRPNCFLKQAAK